MITYSTLTLLTSQQNTQNAHNVTSGTIVHQQSTDSDGQSSAPAGVHVVLILRSRWICQQALLSSVTFPTINTFRNRFLKQVFFFNIGCFNFIFQHPVALKSHSCFLIRLNATLFISDGTKITFNLLNVS
jgi:hypothetical protein